MDEERRRDGRGEKEGWMRRGGGMDEERRRDG